MLSVDLNSDVGEGYPNDEKLMSYVSSVNIACSAHAGSPDIMKQTVELAIKHGVAIGAHPSYPDKENFGRVDLIGTRLKLDDLPKIIVEQLAMLEKICTELQTQLHHVKLHGALYNRAASDSRVCSKIFQCLAEFFPMLVFYGLSGSQMEKTAEMHHIKFVPEVFADRTYREDGFLTPRSEPNAMIGDVREAASRALQMVSKGTVPTISGKDIIIRSGTICIHGDGDHALDFAKSIKNTFDRNGISVNRPTH